MEPIQQVVVIVRIVITCFIAEQFLHTCIFGSNSPFVAEDFIDHVGRCLIGRIVRINECPFSPSVILLGKVPQQETDIFQVGFILVVMVACRKERQIMPITFFESADESSPDISLRDDILEVSGHTDRDLLGFVSFKRIDQLGSY